MSSLVLHVGLHKTATTSFQCFLAERDRLLAGFGCLYPLAARAPGPQHALLPGCYFPNHPFLPKDRSLSVDQYINELAEELAMAPYSLCVMSSEVFTELLNFDAAVARVLIDRLSERFSKLVVLLTLRNIPELAYSDLKNRLRDISLGLRRDFAFSAPMFFNRIEMHKQRERKMWRSLGVEIVEKCMDDGDPVMSYFGAVLDMMPVIERAGLQSAIVEGASAPEERNSDPYAEVEYLLVMIAGLKLAAAGKKWQRTRISITQQQLVNTTAIAHSCKDILHGGQWKWFTKISQRFAPVRKNIHRWVFWTNSHCPGCHQDNEDEEHIFKCAHRKCKNIWLEATQC
jgi:hypothetical protein